MSCPSGKTSFESEDLAEEALVQNHIRNNHRKGAGPRDVYECVDCGRWHFTSRQSETSILTDEEVLQRIEKERRTLEWEHKFR